MHFEEPDGGRSEVNSQLPEVWLVNGAVLTAQHELLAAMSLRSAYWTHLGEDRQWSRIVFTVFEAGGTDEGRE